MHKRVFLMYFCKMGANFGVDEELCLVSTHIHPSSDRYTMYQSSWILVTLPAVTVEMNRMYKLQFSPQIISSWQWKRNLVSLKCSSVKWSSIPYCHFKKPHCSSSLISSLDFMAAGWPLISNSIIFFSCCHRDNSATITPGGNRG